MVVSVPSKEPPSAIQSGCLIEFLHQARLATCSVILVQNTFNSRLVEGASGLTDSGSGILSAGFVAENQLLSLADHGLHT